MAQGKNFAPLARELAPAIHNELYPFSNDYYHELNPYFGLNLTKSAHLSFCDTITLRDGEVAFGAFLVHHFAAILKTETIFFVHPNLARIVPSQLRDRFLAWEISLAPEVRSKPIRNLLIAGLANPNCLGNLARLREKLEFITQLPPDVSIEVYLPYRKNPLDAGWKETYLGYEAAVLIKELAVNRKITFLKSSELLGRSNFQGTELVNVFDGTLLLCDSFLDHFVAARGGLVSSFTSTKGAEPLFELDLSFYHRLRLTPLPESPSIFNEIFFYKKLNPTKELHLDPQFQLLFR